MIRLGFPVRVVGQPGLRACGSHRSSTAHLSLGLLYLRDILAYLQRIGVSFYRIASRLLPTAPPDHTLQQSLQQITDCRAELAALAVQVQSQGLRLTLHLDHHIILSSPDERLAARSIAAIEAQATLLQHLGTGTEGSLVIHVPRANHDPSTLARFVQRYAALSAPARARLAVEHDPAGADLLTALRLHQLCGVPVVFDYLHWQLDRSRQIPLALALGMALATWPPGIRPEVHLSTARSEAHLRAACADQPARVLPPRPGQHADFIAPADAHHLLHAARGLPPFDLMLEAKAGDLALLRLRDHLLNRQVR